MQWMEKKGLRGGITEGILKRKINICLKTIGLSLLDIL